MKIGIDARFYSSQFTGIGRYSFELIKNLAQIDDKNEYVVFLNNPQYDEFTPPNERWSKVLADTPHYSFKEQFKYVKILEAASVDLMHFTHFNAPLMYRKPSIVTIHDLTLSLYPGAKMSNPLRRFAYHRTISSIAHRAKKIIAVSQKTKEDVVHFLRVPAKKIQTIYEAVSDDFYAFSDDEKKSEMSRMQSAYNIKGEYLLYTGVWRNHKNLVNLLRAFSLLKNKHDYQGQLIITGKEDPYYPEVKETVKLFQLQNDVIFTGIVPEKDLVALMNCASVYVMPSLYEGFGLPILEAFACGTPVACSRTSCLPEIAGAGNALLFDPHDPTEIAAYVWKLLSDTSLQNELREKGLVRVKDFSWERMARETLATYQSALLV